MKRIRLFHLLAALDLLMVAFGLLMTAFDEVVVTRLRRTPFWPRRLHREATRDWYQQSLDPAQTKTPPPKV